MYICMIMHVTLQANTSLPSSPNTLPHLLPPSPTYYLPPPPHFPLLPSLTSPPLIPSLFPHLPLSLPSLPLIFPHSPPSTLTPPFFPYPPPLSTTGRRVCATSASTAQGWRGKESILYSSHRATREMVLHHPNCKRFLLNITMPWQHISGR